MNQPHLIIGAAGIPTFLRIPFIDRLDAIDAGVVVVGLPTDDGSFGEDGARFGARAIRRASLRFPVLRGYWDEREQTRFLQPEMSANRVVDAGDIGRLMTNAAGTFEIYTGVIRSILAAGAMPLVFGGDQAVTLAVLSAFDSPVQVVHFSAHVHSAPPSDAAPFTAPQTFTQVRQRTPANTVAHIGARGLRNPRSEVNAARDAGELIVTAGRFRAGGIDDVLAALDPNLPVYVSLNVDALDISIARGCSTPEPDGLTYKQLRDTLAAIAARAPVVGFDVVEVNPLLDARSQNTAFVAAQLALEFLARIREASLPREATR